MAAVMALIVVASAAVVMMGDESEAAISGDYGEVYEIDLAPGFRYTYTPAYPSDLTVTTSILQYESQGITASVSGGTLTVTVNDGVTSGSYDLILQATTSTGGISQTAYQHIRFNIVEGLSVSGSINNIILGASVNFTPSASSGMTSNIDWTVNGSLPAGLSWSGGRITGTPTETGLQRISLTANAAGETAELEISFIVYAVIVNGSDQSIFSHGNTVSTTAVAQTSNGDEGDLTVTWAITDGTLPSGFSLNASTGVISGSSTTLQEITVTVTGTSTNMSGISQQTASFDVTIRSEPSLSLSGDSGVTIYEGSPDRTVQVAATSGTSSVTWSVTSAAGVSINQSGLVTITDAASAGTVTVTARTAYGQTATHQITITAESELVISGSDTVSAIAGTPTESTYTANGTGVTWSVDDSGAPEGVTVSIGASTGILTLSGSGPTGSFTVTITAESASGQTATMTVTCQIVSELVFDTVPSNGAAAWVL